MNTCEDASWTSKPFAARISSHTLSSLIASRSTGLIYRRFPGRDFFKHPLLYGDRVATIHVSSERTVDAPADSVYRYLADMREHHPRFLPPAFEDFEVESGGVGAGTVTRFTLNAGGRKREYRMQVAEPEPGRVLSESDTDSSLVTTFTVDPDGDRARVRISTTWEGAGGIGGFFERTFAPRAMRRLYEDELERLNRYAREHARQS